MAERVDLAQGQPTSACSGPVLRAVLCLRARACVTTLHLD